jgi:hypothetical protein
MVMATSGCLVYSRDADTTPATYAKIAAIEIASSALLALVPDDDPNSDYSKTPYAERAAIYLGGAILLDAFAYIVTEKDKH